MSRRRRRIKIIATLGPASAEREVVAALFQAGADVFRINMSHASHDGMRERVALIRSLEDPATGLWYLDYNGNGVWDGTATDKLYSFGGGVTGAVPVTGKW